MEVGFIVQGSYTYGMPDSMCPKELKKTLILSESDWMIDLFIMCDPYW